MDRDVVAGDDRLRRQIDVLLAQIDRRQAGARVGPVDRAWLVDKRHQDVQSFLRLPVESSQTFNQHDCGLRHDSDGLRRDNQQHDPEKAEEHEGKKCGEWFHDSTPIKISPDYIASSIISAACRTISSANGRPTTCTSIGKPSFDRPTGTVTTGRSKTLNACA